MPDGAPTLQDYFRNIAFREAPTSPPGWGMAGLPEQMQQVLSAPVSYTTGGGFGGPTPENTGYMPGGWLPNPYDLIPTQVNLSDVAPFLIPQGRLPVPTRQMPRAPGLPMVPEVLPPGGVLTPEIEALEEGLPVPRSLSAAAAEERGLNTAGMPENVQTPEFRNWFGNSQVVDEGGRPLQVYHGTPNSGFGVFDTYGGRYGLMGSGAYFTENPSIASEYTGKGVQSMLRRGEEPAQGVYPVYLSLQNPMDMAGPAEPTVWANAFGEYISANEAAGLTNEQAYRIVEENLMADEIPDYEGAEIMQDGLRSMGHDGITHLGGGRVNADGVRHRVWIIFEPEQIKSTNNPGTFNPNNPDIMAQTRGPLSQFLRQANA